MKIEELRIGNWVCRAEKFTEKVDIGFFVNYDASDLMIAYYSSIPLTEDWLENFGFIKTDDSGYCELEFEGTNTRLFITLDDELAKRSFGKCYYGFDHHVNAEIQLNIQYVHQLQNLVFALTGKDLILKSESWD